MEPTDWPLTATERGSPAVRLDARRGEAAWTGGNRVRPLVIGAVYFSELLAALRAQRAGDLCLFTE
ncbi:hypothetical protein [Streptomyces thermolilacinus]|uniref:hypothetical protein n=1 Tax=Streptomyces thermolilacinus TaxID=285540 RepID=UPI0003C761D9|nr:hypothetical protein [Streptomyces thermolilacinus]